MGDLISLLVNYSQKVLAPKLMLSQELEAVVLEARRGSLLVCVCVCVCLGGGVGGRDVGGGQTCTPQNSYDKTSLISSVPLS